MMSKIALVVDDEKIGQQLLNAILVMNGIKPVLAGNAEEALNIIKAVTPDIFILDIMMPAVNGFQLTRQIRSMERFTNTPILLVSALDDRKSKTEGVNAGANGYITKPYDKNEIIAQIKELVY